jgi:hypothetical protein
MTNISKAIDESCSSSRKGLRHLSEPEVDGAVGGDCRKPGGPSRASRQNFLLHLSLKKLFLRLI